MSYPKELTEILDWYIDTKISNSGDKKALVGLIENNIRGHDSIKLADGTIYTVSFRPQNLEKISVSIMISCAQCHI